MSVFVTGPDRTVGPGMVNVALKTITFLVACETHNLANLVNFHFNKCFRYRAKTVIKPFLTSSVKLYIYFKVSDLLYKRKLCQIFT
jgi:hypothetical protein